MAKIIKKHTWCNGHLHTSFQIHYMAVEHNWAHPNYHRFHNHFRNHIAAMENKRAKKWPVS